MVLFVKALTDTWSARLERALATYGPLCLGSDPSASVLASWGMEDSAAGLASFGDALVERAAGLVGLVKPQVSYYERLGWEGMRALSRLIDAARAAGMLVIADVKRADIASTLDASARAWLGGGSFGADAMTLTPWMGVDALAPALRLAADRGCGVFVVVRSSNPEGVAVQGPVAHGVLARLVEWEQDLGGGSVGLVVGATLERTEVHAINQAAPELWRLAPGLGVQGAGWDDLRASFGEAMGRTLPVVARSLLAGGAEGARERIAQAAQAARSAREGIAFSEQTR